MPTIKSPAVDPAPATIAAELARHAGHITPPPTSILLWRRMMQDPFLFSMLMRDRWLPLDISVSQSAQSTCV